MTVECGKIEITEPKGGNGDTGPGGGDGQQDQKSSGYAKEALLLGGTAIGTYLLISEVTVNET